MADFIRGTYVPAAAQSLSPPAEKFLVESSWSKVRGRDLLISARRSGVGYEHPGGGPTAVTRPGMLSIRAFAAFASNQREPPEEPVFRGPLLSEALNRSLPGPQRNF